MQRDARSRHRDALQEMGSLSLHNSRDSVPVPPGAGLDVMPPPRSDHGDAASPGAQGSSAGKHGDTAVAETQLSDADIMQHLASLRPKLYSALLSMHPDGKLPPAARHKVGTAHGDRRCSWPAPCQQAKSKIWVAAGGAGAES